jgi:NAD(P)-dependent dehydrogenase (short-subunit alcohol dehydrogenase family)
MRRFDGRRVVVTGGSSGIGRAIVLAFADEGAKVVASGRDRSRLDAVAAAAPSGAVEGIVADLREPEAASRLVEASVERLGGVDVLVNCAGVAHQRPILDLTPDVWHDTMQTNLSAPFFASQAAARHMAAAGGGAIVNVASIDAFQAESPDAPYCASKAGLVMLTQSFAVELGHLGIRCNAVAPGLTDTPMLLDDLQRPAFRASYLRRIPSRRASRPEEQASVVLFLASDDASYVNGETVVVDGGQTKGFWYDAEDAPPVD